MITIMLIIILIIIVIVIMNTTAAVCVHSRHLATAVQYSLPVSKYVCSASWPVVRLCLRLVGGTILCLPETQLTLGSNARSFLSTSNFSLGSWCMCWYNICHPWQAVAKLLFSFSHAMSSNHSEITATSQNCTSTSHNCFSQLLVTIYKQSFIASSLLAQDLANVAF